MGYFISALALLFFDFVAAEVFLGLGEANMLAQDWIVFFKRELVWGVHGIFLGIIRTNPGLLRDETN